jgi:hypothetical protein
MFERDGVLARHFRATLASLASGMDIVLVSINLA